MMISAFYDHIRSAAEKANCSVAEILTAMHDNGVCGIDFIYSDYVSHRSFLSPLLSSLNMHVASLIYFSDFAHGEPAASVFPVVDLAASLDCNDVLVIPGIRQDGDNNEEIVEAITNALILLTAYAASHGVTVSLEDYDDKRASYQDSTGLCSYIRRVPGLGCTFDTGNFIPVGETTEDAFSRLKDNIVHVHCKDRMRDSNCVRAFGQGDVDFLSFFRLLRSIHYTGALTIEQYCEEGTTLESLLTSASTLKNLWNASENT